MKTLTCAAFLTAVAALAATTAAARLVVTVQMMIDLVILGLGARVILGAVTRGRQRRTGS